MRAYKYRLFPDINQQAKLWLHANKLNFLYNYFLNKRKEHYEKNKAFLKLSALNEELTVLKQNDPIISEIHSQVLQQVTRRLEKTYKAFFRGLKRGSDEGFPKFRSCNNFFGICYPQSGFTLKKNTITTKAYGEIEFLRHMDWHGEIKQVYITNRNNKFYLCITTDYEGKKTDNNGKPREIGIDVGLKHLVVGVDDQGEITKIKSPGHAKYFDKQIASVQSRRDKKVRRSNRWRRLNKVKNRLYDAKDRKIKDFQHKASRKLCSKYDIIYAEDLSLKEMSESELSNLNKALRNAKIAGFLSMLGYKANKFIKVNPKNTSRFHECGYIKYDLKLSDRIITCGICGKTYDRDENAARNIFCLGQAILSGCIRSDQTVVEAHAFRRG